MVLITFLLYPCISAYLAWQKSYKKKHQNSDSKTWRICMGIKNNMCMHIHVRPRVLGQSWKDHTSSQATDEASLHKYIFKIQVHSCMVLKSKWTGKAHLENSLSTYKFMKISAVIVILFKISQWQAQIRNREIPQHCGQVVQSWVKITQG